MKEVIAALSAPVIVLFVILMASERILSAAVAVARFVRRIL